MVLDPSPPPLLSGPQLPGPMRLGFALNATAGRLWVSRDGIKMKGDPSTSQGGFFLLTLPAHYLWHPAAARVCGEGSATVQMYLGVEDSMYDAPARFAPFKSSVCDCSKAYQQCSEIAACVDSIVAGRIYEECFSNVCNAIQCGISVEDFGNKGQRACGPEVDVMCTSQFLTCSEAQCGVSCSHGDACGIVLVCKSVDSFHELLSNEGCPFGRCRCSITWGASNSPSCGVNRVEEGSTSSSCECG